MTVMQLGAALRRISELRARDWARNDIQTALVLENVPAILAQEDQMQLVLLYLIKNAEESVLRSPSNRRLRIHLTSVNKLVCLEIQDSGPGLAPDVHQRVFQLSLTPAGTGSATGLGLAIASSIIRQHKGQIRFHSKPGQGASFIVELPEHVTT